MEMDFQDRDAEQGEQVLVQGEFADALQVVFVLGRNARLDAEGFDKFFVGSREIGDGESGLSCAVRSAGVQQVEAIHAGHTGDPHGEAAATLGAVAHAAPAEAVAHAGNEVGPCHEGARQFGCGLSRVVQQSRGEQGVQRQRHGGSGNSGWPPLPGRRDGRGSSGGIIRR